MRTKLALMCIVALVATVAAAQQPTGASGATAAPPAAAAKVAETAQPVMEVPEKIKDFGVVAKGEKLKYSFAIRNTGKAPLEIREVRPTCGCTVASYDRTIAPGASGKVSAEVDTSAFSGVISKVVLVFTNDPTTPQLSLILKAEVRSYVEVLPRPLIFFRNVMQGEQASEKVILVSVDGGDFKVIGIDSAGGPYQTSFRELPEKERDPKRKGSQWEVTVTVPATAPEGTLNHKLIVKTTAAKAPEVTINVSGNVRPVVQVIPAEVNFGIVNAGAPIGHNILVINNRQGTELQLSDVKVDSDVFTTEVMPQQAGQRYLIAITLKASAAKGQHNATLKFATNDPTRKQIEIPVVATVQ